MCFLSLKKICVCFVIYTDLFTLRNTLKPRKISKYCSLKGAGATCELAFISKDPENILRKFKKPRKLRQGRKILISVFFFRIF